MDAYGGSINGGTPIAGSLMENPVKSCKNG
jgi:hypothetical protein